MVKNEPMKEKIIVVDDDVKLTNTIAVLLEEEGFNPLLAHTAEDGLLLALSAEPDLCLLDIMIPIMGGYELCAKIRQRSQAPIIFLSALEEVSSIEKGLGAGGDDYLVKPYKPRELIARIKAHLRRIQHPPAPNSSVLSFSNGELQIDLPSRLVVVKGKVIDLTPREYDLLMVLALNVGRVITTSELIQLAWGTKFRDATENIKPYIHYLRKKIEEDPAEPRWILTARGVGYRFVDST